MPQSFRKPIRILRHSPRVPGRVGEVRQVRANGAIHTTWDGKETGEERWEGRWYAHCSLHGTRRWFRSYRMLREAVETAAFCTECHPIVLENTPCNLCNKAYRGCAMCVPGWVPKHRRSERLTEEEKREIVRLRDEEGIGCREIERRLKRPESTIRSAYRAMKARRESEESNS